MARKTRQLTKDETVDEMMARFDHAYDISIERFIVMQRIQDAYDNNINSDMWPTISEIGLPITFNSVEEQLPFVMKYLYPKNRFINLTPQSMMNPDAVKRIENDLRYTLRTKMDAEIATLPSIKDCYKFGVGYGLVDTMLVTNPTVVNNILIQGEEVIDQIPQMRIGQPVQVPVYKYIAPGCVIPMPDGANVDGTNKASGHFVIEMKTESEFRDMFAQVDSNGRPYMTGNVDDIVNDAKNLNFDRRALNANLIHSLAGYDLAQVNQPHSQYEIPVVIPIVRCYFDHHHVWIANGNTKIWEAKDKYQSMMSDLVKWSAWPDGTRWFPQNITEASEQLASGMNIWYNGMVDLAMYMMNPSRVINADKVDHPDDIGRGPRSDIKVRGNPNEVIKYMDLPAFPGALHDMGGVLERFHATTNAQVRSVRDGQAGMVRGGTNALETMLSSSTGRQYLAGIVLKAGALKPLIEKTLIKKQLLADKVGSSFIQESFDKDTGERMFVKNNVTLRELRNVFQVELDMPIARLNSAASLGERTAFFDRAQQKPELFDQRALYEELTEDDAMVRRVMLPENVVKKRQEENAQAELEAKRAGVQQGQGASGQAIQQDQGIAGPPPQGGAI